MKNRKAIRPEALCTVPAKAVGMAPANRIAAKVHLGPKRSHAAPAVSRTNKVEVKPSMFEVEMSAWERWRSFLMVTVNSGGKAYHDQKAMKNDHHDSRKTLP